MTSLAMVTVILIGAIGGPAQDAVPPPPPSVRLADDVCAIMLAVRAQVSDSHGKPVAGAEVRGQDQTLQADDWHVIGYSDATGRVEQPFCFQRVTVYSRRPPGGLVTLRFSVAKHGGLPVQIERRVQASTLIRDGLLVKRQGGNVVPDPDALRRRAAFRVSLHARLE